MVVALEAAAGTDDAAVSRAAEARGVLLAPLSRYTVSAARRGWLLGPVLGADWPRLHPLFSAMPEDQRGPGTQRGLDLLHENLGLDLVGKQDGDDFGREARESCECAQKASH